MMNPKHVLHNQKYIYICVYTYAHTEDIPTRDGAIGQALGLSPSVSVSSQVGAQSFNDFCTLSALARPTLDFVSQFEGQFYPLLLLVFPTIYNDPANATQQNFNLTLLFMILM